MPPDDDALLFIEQVEYRRHVIKIARRANQIKLLIYPPATLLATRMITDALSNYENALTEARHTIDRMIPAEGA